MAKMKYQRRRKIEHAIDNGIIWKKVERPTSWRPQTAGATLIGKYLGTVTKNGSYGIYTCLSLQTENGVVYHASGSVLMDLLAGLPDLQIGMYLRVIFLGVDETTNRHRIKRFELYVEDRR